MKKKKNLVIILLILCLLIGIASIIFIYRPSKEQEKPQITSTEPTEIKQNNNKNFTEDKVINDITFTNITCTYDGVNSLLEYTITNHTDETIHLDQYEIIIKNKDNQVLANLAPSLNQDLAPEEIINTGDSINIDLTTAYSMELVLAE